jgi:cold shock CspA family protein
MSVVNETSSTVYHGRVKWFNNKAGYGFITVIDGPQQNNKVGQDIFAHHTSICVSEEQYKYLVQGEYVEFQISAVNSDADTRCIASNVKGVTGGKLLCETRNENRIANLNKPDSTPRTPVRNSRFTLEGQRVRTDDGAEWYVSKNRITPYRKQESSM